MILEFSQAGRGGSKFLVGLGNNHDGVRIITIAGLHNNFVFESLDSLKKVRPLSPAELIEIQEIDGLIANARTDEVATEFVIHEMRDKLGLEFIGEMSVEEYLDRYKENGFRQ